MRVPNTLAASAVICFVAASSAQQAVAGVRDGKCLPTGHVLARGPGVEVWWSANGQTAGLDACLPRSGAVRRVVHAEAGATGVAVAGPYVGFEYSTANHLVLLDVFDALTGHTELRHTIGNVCLRGGGGSDNVCGADFWRLAPDGWIAILDTQGDYGTEEPGSSNQNDLLASDGRVTATGLDAAAGGRLRLRGSTLDWSVEGGASYAAPLGPELDALASRTLPPPAPLPSPCELLAGADVVDVLGAVTATAVPASNGCSYRSVSEPQATFALTLTSDLTTAQVLAAKTLAYDSEAYYYTGPPRYGDYRWTAAWDSAAGGRGASRVVRFVGNTELSAELSGSDPGDALGGTEEPLSLNWDAEAATNHLMALAFDRLMGWDVLEAKG